MKRLLVIISLMLGLMACSSNDDYSFDNLPDSIADFLSEYWPNMGYAAYHTDDDGYIVIIKDGAKITFSRDMDWTSVDGLGATLPQQFLYDQLPPILYNYIESGENTNQVFSATRTSKKFTVTLLNAILTYDIDTGMIHQHSD